MHVLWIAQARLFIPNVCASSHCAWQRSYCGSNSAVCSLHYAESLSTIRS